MKKIAVSNELAAFIEKKFQSMLKFQKELEEQRELIRPELKRKEQREYKRMKRENIDFKKTTPKRMSADEIALRGKAKLDFNEFIYLCDCLLRKENQEVLALGKYHRKDIHHWISDFLTQRGYKKDEEKPYTSIDIKGIINRQFEDNAKDIYGQPNYDKSLKKCYEALFDHMYKEFYKKVLLIKLVLYILNI